MLTYTQTKDLMKTRDSITYDINNFLQFVLEAIVAAPAFKTKWPFTANIDVDTNLVDAIIESEGTDQEYVQIIFAVKQQITFVLAIPATILESGRQDIMNYVNYSLNQGQYTSHTSPNAVVVNIGLPNP